MQHTIMHLARCFPLWILLLGLPAVPAAAQTDPGRWIAGSPLPTPRQEMPHAVIDGKIYIGGGIDGNRVASDVMEIYDPATGRWTPGRSLPLAMHHLGMAAANGKLYIVGGYQGNSFTPTGRVFEYDPLTEQWAEKTPMPIARGAHTAVTIDDQIYVVGGVAFGGNLLGTNQRYDPASDTWTPLRAMPTPREHLAATALDGKMYVIGGRSPITNFRTLEAYDPATDTWEQLQGMPTARGGLAAAALHGKLYVFGGEFPGVFPQNEEYDPTTDRWRTMAPMPVPRHGIGAAAVGDTLFIIGGGPVAGFGVSDVNAGFVPPRPAPTDLAQPPTVPAQPLLYPNHPNPVITRTTIRFSLPHAGPVTLAIYDVLGRSVTTLLYQHLPPGEHEHAWQPTNQPNGVYLYRLQAGRFSMTRTFLVLR